MNNHYDKLTRFCLYRERCRAEVLRKMFELGVKEAEYEFYLNKLISEGYLNEMRFISSFIHAKIYIKKWGKKKIESELIMKKIDRKLIQQQFEEVDDEMYIQNLTMAAEKKWLTLGKKSMPEKKQSIIRFLLSRGYEIDLIMDWVKTQKN